MHPTREKLIMTMVRLLDGPDPEHVTVEEVLNESGISRGSLYHHFADFEELHETGLAYRITQWVNDSVASMSKILESAQSRQDVIKGVLAITAKSQDSRRRLNRLERARAFGLAGFSPRFQAVLGVEQARMTNALHDLIDAAKRRGWIRTDVDSMATAVFIQAYTLGRVVDDISTEKVDPQKWNDLIDKIIVNHLFYGD
jgi:AcrR family transcriptional regulator